MGEARERQVGTGDCDIRVLNRIHNPPTEFFLQVQSAVLSGRGSQLTTSSTEPTSTRGCETSARSPGEAGVLLEPFPSTQKGWQSETGPGLKEIESIRQDKTFPYGVSQVRDYIHAAGGISVLDRYQGRLPSYPNPGNTSEIPPLRNTGKALSVYGAAIRPVYVTKSFHEGTSSSDGASSCGRYRSYSIPRRHTNKSTIVGRQRQEPARWDTELVGNERGGSHTDMGREASKLNIRGVHPRSRKLDGGLPKPGKDRSRRMGPASRNFSDDMPEMGHTRCGPHGVTVELQDTPICVPSPGPTGSGNRCPDNSVEGVQTPIRIPANPAHTEDPGKNQAGRATGDIGSTKLAKKELVRGHHRNAVRHTVAPSGAKRPAIPGAFCSPGFQVSTFDGLAVETEVLRRKGYAENVIQTMIRARKAASSAIYYRVWKRFFIWCEERRLQPMQFSVSRILAFLQSGLEIGLRVGSLRGQVSALTVLFQRPIANRMAVRTFLQGVAHTTPPFKPPVQTWELNLVLDTITVQPFEPLKEIPMRLLTWKVAFLVAITSIRRVSELAALSIQTPYMAFHQDKVVLRPSPEFLPKVVSQFHINEEIVLPSFCPNPVHKKEKLLHHLDVVRALRTYVKRTRDFRKTDSLFVIPEGTRRGLAASKVTLSKWIRSLITEAYRASGRSPPFRVTAHSTQAVGASWAVRHGASALQVCKAATWTSVHTFSKFYRVHIAASSDAALGRKILQAAVV
ncbi:uncharacterized protein [Eleutherodactylus coqui]|uniref:uncharacterized protein n=1 Tax=Eleutherodactylus coqui TaxID=57060 RepID=UPI00346325B7